MIYTCKNRWLTIYKPLLSKLCQEKRHILITHISDLCPLMVIPALCRRNEIETLKENCSCIYLLPFFSPQDKIKPPQRVRNARGWLKKILVYVTNLKNIGRFWSQWMAFPSKCSWRFEIQQGI